jgi:hypothetical protein
MTTPVKWWRVKNQLLQGERERLTDTWQHLWNGEELKINYFRGRTGEGERLADTWQHLWNGEELKIHYFKQRKGEGERLTDTWQHLWNGEELKINYFRIRKGGRGETDWHKVIHVLSSRVFHLFDKGWMDKQNHTGNYYIIHMVKVEGLNISSL